MNAPALPPVREWLLVAGAIAIAAGCSSGASSPAQSVDGGVSDARDDAQDVESDAESDAASQGDGGAASSDAESPSDGGATTDAAGDGGSGTERGLSAWVYENRQPWADEMNAYDSAVSVEHRLRYLFPYAGGASIAGAGYGTQSVWFDGEVIDYYAARLPDARLLPIFDCADGVALADWGEADQRQLAGDVADELLANENIAGAQVDIEPFRVEHLPFYDELGERLHAEGKSLTVFTGASSGDIYSIADVVVLSGYDLGISPVTPSEYEAALHDLVGAALASAAAAGTRLMVGVPIAASWEEYATQSGTCDEDTGFAQEQWFSAALAAICPHTGHASYLGLSLWGFYGDALEIPRGSGCFRNPGAVPPANWMALTDWGNGSCN
jgi:hypothetical protein